jgi:diguanylate cyclase (GGDEF)-like protein
MSHLSNTEPIAVGQLLSRIEFNEEVQRELDLIDEDGREVALLCFKIEHLNTINPTYGHSAGDAALEQVVARAKQLLGPNCLMGRLCGDEFAILQTSATQPNEARKLAQRLQSALLEPYVLDEACIELGVSLGISLAPYDAREAAELVRSACMARAQGKKEARNGIRFYEAQMDIGAKVRRKLEHALRRAIQDCQLELHYQPLLCLASNRIVGAEALVRWEHPELGKVSPADFIPLAEEMGLVVPLGRWVLEQACRDATYWPDDRRVAVNVSSVQLEDRSFLQTVERALESTGLPADRLELEVTETSLIRHGELTVAILSELRELGVKVALDDFGTGYSSINYLRQFPFDKIKIDRSFIAGVNNDPEAAALVHMIAALGVAIAVTTTAEGIETVDELATVISAGCTQIQGYLLSRPLRQEQLLSFESPLTPAQMVGVTNGASI